MTLKGENKMNALIEIVVNEVNKVFKTEKAFYEDYLHTTQQSWNRWKRGERGFSDDKMDVIKSVLFTDYEWMLVSKIDKEMRMYPQNYEGKTAVEVFDKAKLLTASQWVNMDANIRVNSARNADSPNDGIKTPGTKVIVRLIYENGMVYDEDVISFYVKQSSGHIKAGKENRLKWFRSNINELI